MAPSSTGAVRVPSGGYTVHGDLHGVRSAAGIVVFVHGSGVTRRDLRNRNVARCLQRAGFATLLVDLLEEFEMRHPGNVFAVGMQADRLADVIRWAGADRRTRALPLGLFGAGIGAGAALIAAANMPQAVRAVVCRGGRPDCAAACLPRVKAPTLFIDEHPDAIPDWCDQACCAMRAPARIVRLAGADLQGEPDAIRAVARHAERWFAGYLARRTDVLKSA